MYGYMDVPAERWTDGWIEGLAQKIGRNGTSDE